MPAAYRFPEFGELAADITEVLIAITQRRHLYIHGMPGSGKDALIHAISAKTRRPTLLKQVQPDADIQSWFYSRSFDKDGTKWEEGELLKALRDGYTTTTGRVIPYLILVSDFDRATKIQAEYLRLVLDSILGRVEGPEGLIYDVLPGTQIVATGNTAGSGDTRGRFVSTNIIDASLLERFDRVFALHWLDWRDELIICKEKFPLLAKVCPALLDQVGNATKAIREAIYQEDLYCEFSHRAVCSWLGHAEDVVRATGQVSENIAQRAARAVLDGMPDNETRLQVERLIDPHIQGGIVGKNSIALDPDDLDGMF
jgi:hypothetical protein